MKQYEIERQRNATLSALYAGMSERELVAELQLIDADDRVMHLDRRAPQANWERNATRSRLVRTELANRRAGTLTGTAYWEARKPLADAYWSARMSDGSAEGELAAAEAALDAFEAQHGLPTDHLPATVDSTSDVAA